MVDPFVLLACAVGALYVGFLIMALILEHVCYQLRSTRRRVHQLGAETKRLRQIEGYRDKLLKGTSSSYSTDKGLDFLPNAYPHQYVRRNRGINND